VASSAPIGFFDSGVGGLAIRDAVSKRLHFESTIYIADKANCPYGTKPPEFIRERSAAIVEALLGASCKAVVVACNTATAVAIDYLREKWPSVPFIGMEPAVKPAAQDTRSGVICVLATKLTFEGRHFRETCAKHAAGVKVIPCPADEFVEMVERGETGGLFVEKAIREKIEPALTAGADRIVLGCTHFPRLAKAIERVACHRATLIDPAPAIAAQVENVLRENGLLAAPPVMAIHRVMQAP
jgi:glutamate racemase